MKESKFSEKESIELIAQMIQQTKQNMKLGSGNIFLYYGYTTVAISIVVFCLVQFTQEGIWSALWFLMFIATLLIQRIEANQKPAVVTYMDQAINNTWRIVGSLFTLTAIAIPVIGYPLGACHFILMLPLCLLYAGIGTSITGIITKSRVLIYTPLLAFAVAIYMLITLLTDGEVSAVWHLYFGASFFVMMVIPGHLLNRKSN